KDKSEKYFILSAILGGCILISYLVFVIVKNGTQDTAFASICFAIVAVALCGGAYHIFNKLYNLVPKSERERIKAEKLAEEARKKQLAEVQSHEVTRPEPQQPQIVVQNTIVNQHEIINEVNTEVVNNVVNDITNNNVNMVEAISVANADAQANAEAQAPTDVNVESPTINVTPPEVKVEPPVVNVEVPQPTSAVPFADISDVDTTIGGESYLDTIAAHEQARKKREADKVNAIMAYLKVAMPPFMPKDQVERLCREVFEWIKDPEYIPTVGVHVYREFSTLDARHLICNISERLGKNYIGHNRSQFIKELFAETCQQLEEPAIYKNIKERPHEGHIKYDKPDEGSIAFHYELLEQSI
ncbi:MAG: hypothetical protein KBS94_04045, partial [Prevotella sp.]|nr:hypothetical protein [Candidatus Equicola faecalis]